MTVDVHLLTPGCVVLIAAFDDIPEHQFQVDEVFDDLVTGVALTGPLAGGIWRARAWDDCSGHPPGNTIRQLTRPVREGLKP